MPKKLDTPQRNRSFSLRLAAMVLLAVAGCGGPTEPMRVAVSGKVSLDGKPLPTGRLNFVPLEGRTAAVAEVSDGVFETDSSSGPSPGRYQVEIYAVARTGKTIANPDIPGATIEEEIDLVPDRYNIKSELTAEVKDDGDNTFDFTLTSKTPPARRVRRR